MSIVRYRLYAPEDFDALYAIEEACFPPPLRFGRRYMRQLVNSPETAAWIAEDAGIMAGFAIVEWSQRSNATAAYVQTIEVAPAQRGQGVASELLRRVEDSALAAGAQLIWLHVDAENAAAIRLYETRGYACQGREERYYPDNHPALVYAKTLTGSQGAPSTS